MEFIRKHKLIVATIVIQIIALPLILLLVREQQDTRTSAQATTILSFTPTSSQTTPIEKDIYEDVSLDLNVDPGNNSVSFAKIEINYDPNLLEPAAINPVVVNNVAFPVTVEGPILTVGKIQIVVSVGSNQEKVIQTPTKVLTLNMKAIRETDPYTEVVINTNNTQLLSTGVGETYSENVLVVPNDSSIAAVIKINPAPPPPDTTAPAIINPQVINITETTATITWDTDEPASGQSQYGITTSYGNTTTLDPCCKTQFSQNLTGLTPSTTYHIKATSIDEAGNAGVSEDIVFTTKTPPDTTAPTIINPQAINITETTATITWETDEPANGQAVYGLTTSYGGTTPSTPCCSEIFAHDLSSLTPDTLYHFRVTSADEAGNTKQSSDYTFRTLSPLFSILNFNNLKLHGLGSGGDNPNPTSWGTLNPLRPTRILNVYIHDTAGELVETVTGEINYSGPDTGIFTGQVMLPATITNGAYILKIGTPYYLTRRAPGFINLVQGETHDVAPVSLVAGDVTKDNSLSVADYDLIMDCYSDLQAPRNCDDTKKQSADISDDGLVNQDDYNLFLRELSIQTGD